MTVPKVYVGFVIETVTVKVYVNYTKKVVSSSTDNSVVRLTNLRITNSPLPVKTQTGFTLVSEV